MSTEDYKPKRMKGYSEKTLKKYSKELKAVLCLDDEKTGIKIKMGNSPIEKKKKRGERIEWLLNMLFEPGFVKKDTSVIDMLISNKERLKELEKGIPMEELAKKVPIEKEEISDQSIESEKEEGN